MSSVLASLLILYGSQTGNSEAIAKELHAELVPLLPSTSLHLSSMSDFVKADPTLSTLPSHSLLLCILSTTGQGDPPDNAAKFLRALRKYLPPSHFTPYLPSTAYAVLALGDTNYTNFCKPGLRLDGELAKMGGERWLPIALADDGTSLQNAVEPWKAAVLAKITANAPAPAPALTSPTPTPSPSPSVPAPVASPTRAVSGTPSAPVQTGLYNPSSTASAIQQAQAAMRALHLARANASQQDNISRVQLPAPSPSTPSPPTPSSSLLPLPPSLLLFATQTGNSEGIARELHSLYSTTFTPPLTLLSMAQFLSVHSSSILPLSTFPLLFIVISSTGQGDPPDNGLRFLRLLKGEGDRRPGWLSGVRYAVLGLGDSNYETFGAASQRVEKELVKGGAKKLLPREVADDVGGINKVIEPWKRKWMQTLTQIAQETQQSSAPTAAIATPTTETSSAGAVGTVAEEERKEAPALGSTPAVSVVVERSQQSPVANVRESEDDKALQRPKVKVSKPIGLARFHPVRIAVHTTSPPLSTAVSVAPSSPTQAPSPPPSTYFSRRWRMVDTEAVLKGYTPDAPFFARLSNVRYLTTPLAHATGRRVIHLELEMSGVSSEAVLYTPGDSIGCFCVNDWATVRRLAERLGLRLDDVVDVQMKEAGEEAREEVEREKKEPPAVHVAAPSPTSRAQTATPLPTPPLSAAGPSSGGGLSHILSPCTIADILLYAVDIATPPKKTLLRMLAEFAHSEEDKNQLYHLASHGGKKAYDALIASNASSLLDLLTAFPSCRPPLAYLLDHLPALQPRYYSITSSPLVHPTSIHVAYTLVPNGVCTTWLTQLSQQSGFLRDDAFVARPQQPLLGVHTHEPAFATSPPSLPSFSIPIFMRRTHTFTLPQSLSTPLIFVGPGTGVAPFRSFLFHRRCQRLALASGGVAMGMWRGLDLDMEEEVVEEETASHTPGYIDRFKRPPRTVSHPPLHSQPRVSAPPSPSHTAVGDVWLFFGCRAAEQDWLYREDFEGFVGDETLTGLTMAFSRAVEGQKVYVQDRMREEGQRIWEMMEGGRKEGMLFVCGDGGAMAKGVMRAVQDIYMQHGGLTEQAALQRVAQLMRDKRYVQDVWS